MRAHPAPRHRIVPGAVLLAWSLACTAADGPAATRTVTVFAAASLEEPFRELAGLMARKAPGTTVSLTVAGSQQLASQLVRGAVADVFAAADREAMQFAADRGLVLQPTPFAGNRLVIVAVDRPDMATILVSPLNLATPGLKLVLAAPEVPAGRYARAMLLNLSRVPGYGPDFPDRVLANVRTDEADVRQVLARVQRGEADAGIVYRSMVAGPDSLAARRGIRLMPIPAAVDARPTYVIARLRSVDDTASADAFIRLVRSAEGQAILARHGFAPPP